MSYTRYKYRRICYIPVQHVEAINKKLDEAGYGPNNFTIPLYTKGNKLPIMYACDIQMDDKLMKLMNELIESLKINNTAKNKVVNDFGTLKTANRFDSFIKDKGVQSKPDSVGVAPKPEEGEGKKP